MPNWIGESWRLFFRLVDKESMGLSDSTICHIENSEGKFALTFDDGPSDRTRDVLDRLDKAGARSTFFLLSRNARRFPEIAREILKRGHEVACHGRNHLDYYHHSPWKVFSDLSEGKRELEDLVGAPIPLFRAPYGHFRKDVLAFCKRLGFSHLIGWDIAPPYCETSSDRVSQYVTSRIQPGSIVLLHDATAEDPKDKNGWNRVVAGALDSILTEARKKHLNPCTVSELISAIARPLAS